VPFTPDSDRIADITGVPFRANAAVEEDKIESTTSVPQHDPPLLRN
jgi:hypothetical protein